LNVGTANLLVHNGLEASKGGGWMYIREYNDVDKVTGNVKIKHKLVMSVRTEKGPRQRVVMPLGTLTVERIDWKR